MSRLFSVLTCLLFLVNEGFGQSSSFVYYMNPVIPGDHPDCTLTKVGNDYYTTGSSFNPSPVIYHSTDLVHWEAIAQPVSAAWTNWDDKPSGGCWGGQVVYYNNKWWDFFGQRFTMYFVTADNVTGPWTLPTAMNCPSSVPGLGADNSIFVDDNGNWYLLVKNGQVNNWILQLGNEGQPNGSIYNLCWINPSPSYPYSWAEGPVMWKYKGYYYYCFARDVAGGQYVFRSSTLTENQTAWQNLGNFFNLGDPLASAAVFQGPNHSSAAVMTDDSTSWVVHPLWRNANSNEWYGQGRQGLLNQMSYDTSGKPTADYPVNTKKNAPKLPSSGIPWMVPHSDFFTSVKLSPEWSFLGLTLENTHSLTVYPGWLTLSPKGRNINTVIKNDGEHNYSIITKVHFTPTSVNDQAGIRILNGLQTTAAKLYSTMDSVGNWIVAFSYKTSIYSAHHPANYGNDTLFLKLVRNEHVLSGYLSADGFSWVQVGFTFNVADMDGLQPNYNAWTGNRQGLFVQGSPADFDFYIYRDAYTPILAECPANQYGTSAYISRTGVYSLNSIHDGEWALYAGVEFGNAEYPKEPDSLVMTASSGTAGGVVEVWLDSLDTGTKIAECTISNTGSWDTFATFGTNIPTSVSGNHDVYLKFKGSGTDQLFMLQSFVFKDKSHPETSIGEARSGEIPDRFDLKQNYPNPFNPTTRIEYTVPRSSHVSLTVYDILGQHVETLFEGVRTAGRYSAVLDGSRLASGVFFYRFQADAFVDIKKLVLLK